jgi:hypothetical protein
MKYDKNYELYLVTDSSLCKKYSLAYVVEEAIQGGVTVVQLREKTADTRTFYQQACQVKEVTDAYHIPLIINDRLDIMQAVDAAGVHLGQSDMPLSVARKIIGEEKIIGISASTEEEAQKAAEEGADYLGVGAIFSTDTKKDATVISLHTLQQIKANIEIPIVAIGGIHQDTLLKLKGINIDGIAVVSDIMTADKPKEAARALKHIFYSIKKI